MAGLVPAIHVLQNIRMAGGYVYILTNRSNGILYVGVTRAWKVRKIVVDNPEWNDLYPMIVQ
jgi:predicted GIY-YIG superfamily endonuclease